MSIMDSGMSLVDLGKRLLDAAKQGETDQVRLLMTNGAPFTTDWLGTSPLHMAAQYGHVQTAEVLLRGGISRDARTKVDKTPLHIASQEGHVAIVELLLSHGAEVDARDMLRMTPLHWAVERGHYLVAKMLLKSNADIHAFSKFDKTPLDIAKDNFYEDLIDLLSKHAVNPEIGKKHSPAVHLVQVNQSNSNAQPQVLNVPVFIKSSEDIDSLSSVNSKKSSHANNSSISISETNSSLKSPTIKKRMVIRANQLTPEYLLNQQKSHLKSSSVSQSTYSSDSEEGESSDPSSTNVLTTLAALAEATAPNASISSSEAMHWLEMHGITMLPADNSTLVASAVEGGQTVSLTEAGKLALRFVKKHQNLTNNSLKPSSPSISEPTQSAAVTSTASTPQRVITIVTDQARIPSIISSPQTQIVVLNNQQTDSDPSNKILKANQIKTENQQISNGNSTTEEDESSKLKRELEKMKKEAELYKAQFLQKEHEAELYKKQLEQMKTVPQIDH